MIVTNKICNRSACRRPNAVFYNKGNRQWYCPKCAHKINDYNPGLCVRRLDGTPPPENLSLPASLDHDHPED